MPLKEWGNLLSGELEAEVGQDYINVLQYLIGRGIESPFDHDFYWSPIPGYKDRIIVPFRWQGRIVGNTARKVTNGKPKYLSDQPPHFVFNFDKQQEDQKYIFVCEGPFDALAVGGVALLTNEIAEQQARIINSLGAEVIVIPDQDQAGLVLFDRAAELNWSVAMPNWGDDVKDVAEAVQRYGKLFVIVDAIKTAQTGTIKINMAKKRQENKLEILEYAKENN
jgi:DNA primase